MLTKVMAFILAFALSACATTYSRLPWAKISVEQAEAECHVEVQRNMLVGFGVCMRAKGWEAQ